MKIDYKKELEQASKSMIMVHEPHLLIKLIVRMIVRKLGVKHAGMILYEPEKKIYVLDITKGEVGIKIPSGFTRFNYTSPIIKIFHKKEFKSLTSERNAILSEDINKMIWRESVIHNGNGHDIKELLQKVDNQMQMLNTVACVPAYYQNKLLAVLLLGEKYDNSKFEQDELDFFSALASDAAMAIRNAQLFDNLRKESDNNRKLFIQTITVLSAAIEAKDNYTRGHTERVTQLSLAIARQMSKTGALHCDKNFLEHLYIAGLLHDIGKIGIPEDILNKNGRLTSEEFDVMKAHTKIGVEIMGPLSLGKECIDGILYHHERYDGKGYPEGLKGDEIPASAAIICVADALDAMTTTRPYRKGLTSESAIREIEKNAGKQFHPMAVKALIELYHLKKI